MAAGDEELVDWVDEEGRVIATVPRPEMRARNLLHRTTGTLVFRADGRLFIHERAAAKVLLPGWWDVMASGTVVSGETHDANACRESAEELGVRGVPLYPLLSHRFQDDLTNSLVRVYACQYDGPLALQAEEVAGGFWATTAEADGLVREGKICGDSAAGWKLVVERFGLARPLMESIRAAGIAPIDCAAPAAPP